MIIYDPKYNITKAKELEQIIIYDRVKGEYLKTTKMDLPKTYTLTPRINNKEKEFDLWRASSMAINHQILFPEANGSLKRETYGKATSDTNIKNRGRYVSEHKAPGFYCFDHKYGGPWTPPNTKK